MFLKALQFLGAGLLRSALLELQQEIVQEVQRGNEQGQFAKDDGSLGWEIEQRAAEEVRRQEYLLYDQPRRSPLFPDY